MSPLPAAIDSSPVLLNQKQCSHVHTPRVSLGQFMNMLATLFPMCTRIHLVKVPTPLPHPLTNLLAHVPPHLLVEISFGPVHFWSSHVTHAPPQPARAIPYMV